MATGGAPNGLEFGAPNASSNMSCLGPGPGAGAELFATGEEKAALRRPGLKLGAAAGAGAGAGLGT